MEGTRRNFLIGGIAAVTGASTLAKGKTQADTQVGRSTLPYPSRSIAKVKTLKNHEPVRFFYPDQASPCLLVKLGNEIPGGVGPDHDIVAYSQYCVHQGCPVSYEKKEKTFKCPCHFSLFDAEKNGQMICGQATASLPRIVLKFDPARDEITAIAVEGLIYGRQANII